MAEDRSDLSRQHLRRAFADTVRTLRARAGISQENLALFAGLGRAYMGALERELNTPTLETIDRLLPVLGVSFVEFAVEFEHWLQKQRRR